MRFRAFLITIILLLGIFFILIKCNYVPQTYIEQAKDAVFQEAKGDLGNDCVFSFERFDIKNKIYWIGYVNSQNTHAIMYTAKQNEYRKTWTIDIFSERKGSNAASLFTVKHSIR